MQRIEFDPAAKGPLADVRVLDLSRFLVGNVLTSFLADFGADLIKVEQPGPGDALRSIRDGGAPVYWRVLSRNKRSVVIDLKKPAGVDLVLDLVKSCHMLVENFRPGDLEKLGLSPARLLEANPKLVVVRASGWGATGPYSRKLGFGTLIEAFTGFAAKSGFPGSPPLLPNLGLADTVCGMTGAMAAMVALREAEKPGGAGQVLDVSIMDSMLTLMAPDSGVRRATGKNFERLGNRGQVAAPRNLYPTKDGQYLAMSSSTQSMTVKLFNAMGRPDLLEDERFRDNVARVKNAEVLDEIVSDFMRQRTLDENIAFFDEHRITAGPVNEIDRLMEDPHIQERGSLVEAPDPDLGWLPMPAAPVRLDRTPAVMRRPAPELGQHTYEVLAEFGLAEARIAALEEEGVVTGTGR